ncbi:outer membrane beta-barrel protein [Imtechella halotolerans]|uniref:Outer membrane protein beta-barrel domain-containing protein n=1 Tax=Imtechella halotolerans K1 TaxID=946077 RepID=I0WDC3_9FLAO|nr:outer membrane beta-barrel protein [Imtechella halotolerans]EID74389.1 hypothetical protein W5A_09144 [Imtechella halotolerans K1]WMQ62255.1 outer membrane beta-barrel protein [Imtechella halotolerans]
MKKTLIAFFALATTAAFAQDSNAAFGIKGGFNYNSNGKFFKDAQEIPKGPKIGYHVGLYGKIGDDIYFRPELVYTKTKSDYDGDDFDMSKLDMPLLLGIKVIGPLSVFGGPSLQYILDTDFDGIQLNDVKDEFTIGLNAGVALQLGKLGVDLRYERGLSDNEANFVGISNQGRIDTRPEQLILSLSINL